MTPGTVYLVGAGPGAPGLITVDGVRRLRRADIVIYDYLANPLLLEYAPETAERVLVGKHGGGEQVEQGVITALLIDHARRGRTVVRLKGGDPFVFGRGGEEAEALAAAGIPFEVVPGVTSAIAVPAYAGIPLTHRDCASLVTVLTGYEYPDKRELAVHWDAMAQRGGTLVLLMATRQLRRTMDELVKNGLAADTPAAIIRWGTVAEQTTIVGTAATIADLAQERQVQPPAVAIVGEVVRLREKLSWFERKPLFGRRIVVTRPRHQAAAFVDLLTDAGADVVCCPSIELTPPASWAPVDAAIGCLDTFDWVVFTSVNGVERFFARLLTLRVDVRTLHRARVAAVGSETARVLETHGLLVDVIPEEYRAEAVADAMIAAGVAGARVLLPRAAAARAVLPAMLQAAGATVEEVPVYQTVPSRAAVADVRRLLESHGIDAVTFTSSSTVRYFVSALGDDAAQLLQRVYVGCIGPITAATAQELGLAVAVQPHVYTVPALAQAIIDYFTVTAATASQGGS